MEWCHRRMVSETEKGLQTIMDVLSKTGKEYNMKINVKKTKIRVCRNGFLKKSNYQNFKTKLLILISNVHFTELNILE